MVAVVVVVVVVISICYLFSFELNHSTASEWAIFLISPLLHSVSEMILRLRRRCATSARIFHAGHVKDNDPGKEGYTGRPGWGLGH